MPHITDPNERYFKDGIWGWDPAATNWLPVVIDPATGHLMVDPGDDFEVHQTTPADMRVATHGWDGAVWRKLPLVWGYSDCYLERVRDVAAAANGATLTFSLVPPGEVWVIEHFSTYSSQNAAGPIHLQLIEAGALREITIRPTLAAYTTLAMPHRLVLKANDQLQVVYLNVLLNQVTVAVANGYKMLIAE